jgi:pimeloyl-ACP methyl ester carboxylesterase
VHFYGIWGEKDSWVPITEGERIKNLVESFDLLVIEDAYHCPMETHYNEFNSILLGIMK